VSPVNAADPPKLDAREVQARLDELLWYHTIEVVPGAVSKGWWDLRHALPLLPIPDVEGKRCLDVGTWDGFYAWELARRGAAEVVATDLPDLQDIDWPPEVRAHPEQNPTLRESTQPRPAGFDLVHELLDGPVTWQGCSIYDLSPDTVGTFDLVVVGSLLIHLRDPVRALDAVRSVIAPGGHLLLADYVHPVVNLLSRKRALFELRGEGTDFQWWLATDRGLQQALKVGGFEVDQVSRYFLLRPGSHYPVKTLRKITWRDQVNRALTWRWARDTTLAGHLHRAYLCHPRF
jgi:tRNA (mo5U34)-methyltransferase